MSLWRWADRVVVCLFTGVGFKGGAALARWTRGGGGPLLPVESWEGESA